MAIDHNKTITSDNLSQRLRSGCDTLGVDITEQQHQLLLDYLALFHKWNKAYNLSAVRDIDAMLSRHLLDSLSLVPEILSSKLTATQTSEKNQHWIDVGTGGGLPGIPLAILFPESKITLLDSNGKKTRFLFQVCTELSLSNVEVVQSRVETFTPSEKFSVVFSRAYATLKLMVDSCHHLLQPEGRFFAMKGQQPRQELKELESSAVATKILVNKPLLVPNATGERHLIVIGLAS